MSVLKWVCLFVRFRYGTKEPSSSDEDNLQTAAGSAFKRKRKSKLNLESSNVTASPDFKRFLQLEILSVLSFLAGTRGTVPVPSSFPFLND